MHNGRRVTTRNLLWQLRRINWPKVHKIWAKIRFVIRKNLPQIAFAITRTGQKSVSSFRIQDALHQTRTKELRYEDEAENYASGNFRSLIGELDISDLTANKTDFDLTQLTKVIKTQKLTARTSDWLAKRFGLFNGIF